MSSSSLTKLIAFPVESEKVSAVTEQVIISEDMEQRRRMLDTAGEKLRMFNANKVAQTYKFSSITALKHVAWPTNAPIEKIPTSVLAKAAVSDALNNAANTATNAANTASNVASSMWSAATAAVGAAAHAVSQFGHKTVDTASQLGQATADAASSASHTISVKSHEVAAAASLKSHEVAAVASQRSHEFAEVASAAGNSISQKSREVVNAASDKAYEAKAALSLLKDDITYTTNKAYALALQESERRRRMIDVDEQYAILNARKVASCINGFSFDFYIFDSYVPEGTTLSFNYTFTLLEETERMWRQLPQNSLIAKENATKLATIAKKSFVNVSAPVPAPIPAFSKVEIVDITPMKAGSPAF